MRYKPHYKILITSLALGLLVGCAGGPKPAPDVDASEDNAKSSPVASTSEQKQKFSQALADINSGRLEAAEQTLSELVAEEPEFAAAHNNLGIVYRKRGEFSKAESAYKAALSAAPNNAKAHLNLGILYDIYLQKPNLALAHYQDYQKLSKESDKEVALWIADLKQRL